MDALIALTYCKDIGKLSLSHEYYFKIMKAINMFRNRYEISFTGLPNGLWSFELTQKFKTNFFNYFTESSDMISYMFSFRRF